MNVNKHVDIIAYSHSISLTLPFKLVTWPLYATEHNLTLAVKPVEKKINCYSCEIGLNFVLYNSCVYVCFTLYIN